MGLNGLAALLMGFVVVLAGCGVEAPVARASEPEELPVGDTKVFSLAYSPDGKLLAVGTGGRTTGVKVFDVAAKKEAREIPCEERGAGFTVAFSPDGTLLAVGDFDLTTKVFETKGWTEVASLPGDPERKKYRQARRVAFGSDSKRLAVGYSTGEIYVWDVKGRKVVAKCDHKNEISAIAVSPDGKLIASGTSFGLRLWDAETGKQVVAVDQKSSGKHDVQAIAFAGGKTVVTADSPGFVKSFGVTDGAESASFKMPTVGSDTTVAAVGVTKDGKTVVVPGLMAGLDPERPKTLRSGIVVLDGVSAKPRLFVEGVTAKFLALSPDGRLAAVSTGDSGDGIWIYDLASGVKVGG